MKKLLSLFLAAFVALSPLSEAAARGLINPYRYASASALPLFKATPYTGTGASLGVTTGQDLSGTGGLVWLKKTGATSNHPLFDTVRGANNDIFTNSSTGEAAESQHLNSFDATGFTLGTSANVNGSGQANIALSWLEGADYLDIVTYTGNGANRTISHGLGSVPKMIWVKSRSYSDNFIVYHASLGNTGKLYMDLTQTVSTDATAWNSTTPTSSVFSLGTQVQVNTNAATYVAYVFGEKAGYSKSGSYTGTGASLALTGFGFQPRAIMIKRTDSTANWVMTYNDGAGTYNVFPNLTNARSDWSANITFGADGVTLSGSETLINASAGDYVYFAWR